MSWTPSPPAGRNSSRFAPRPPGNPSAARPAPCPQRSASKNGGPRRNLGTDVPMAPSCPGSEKCGGSRRWPAPHAPSEASINGAGAAGPILLFAGQAVDPGPPGVCASVLGPRDLSFPPHLGAGRACGQQGARGLHLLLHSMFYFTYQEEEAGPTLPANHLLLLALADLQLELLFPLQVLWPPGGCDAGELCAGNAERFPGRVLPRCPLHSQSH